MDYKLGGHRTINEYVSYKLGRFAGMEKSFRSMFELMFSESGNIMYERSTGYRIETTTYAEAKAEASRIAAGLRTCLAGLEPGSVVGLYMKNGPEWIESFWAILAAGYRPLLMNLRLPDPLLHDAMRSADCRAVLSDGRVFEEKTLVLGSP